jgi:hypothetical protein
MKRFVALFWNDETEASVPAKGRFCAKSSENRTMSATNAWATGLEDLAAAETRPANEGSKG